VILSGAAETEHHEIAVSEGLITHAQAMSQDEVVHLLQENLEQKQHTLEEVKQHTKAGCPRGCRRHRVSQRREPLPRPLSPLSVREPP
jgi:ferritin-like metal-binding protein YciE